MSDQQLLYDGDPVATCNGVLRALRRHSHTMEAALEDMLYVRDLLEAGDVSVAVNHPDFQGEVNGVRGLVEAARHYAEYREREWARFEADFVEHEKGD